MYYYEQDVFFVHWDQGRQWWSVNDAKSLKHSISVKLLASSFVGTGVGWTLDFFTTQNIVLLSGMHVVLLTSSLVPRPYEGGPGNEAILTSCVCWLWILSSSMDSSLLSSSPTLELSLSVEIAALDSGLSKSTFKYDRPLYDWLFGVNPRKIWSKGLH